MVTAVKIWQFRVLVFFGGVGFFGGDVNIV